MNTTYRLKKLPKFSSPSSHATFVKDFDTMESLDNYVYKNKGHYIVETIVSA